MKILFLDLQELKVIHKYQIEKYGGLHGLRDQNLLDSAINYPQAMFGKQYLHVDICSMAAAYMYAIIKNHPFIDGNKRTGFMAAVIFLAYNDFFIDAKDDELFDLAIAVAISNVTETDVALFFKNKSIKN